MGMKTTLVWLAFTAGLLIAPGCKPPVPPAAKKNSEDMQLTNVEVRVMEPVDLVEEITLPGIVQPDLSVRLSAEVAGIVREVRVRAGDEVKKGDLLLRIDKTDLLQMKTQAASQVKALEARLTEVKLGARDEQIREAEVAVSAAKSGLELAETLTARRRSLVEQKVMPQEVLDQALGQLTQAQAGYDRAKEILELVKKGARKETMDAIRAQIQAAQASVALTENRLAKTEIRSPITGVVQHRFLDEDEFAGPGMPVFEIIQKSPLKITLGVPERLFVTMKEKDPVLLRFKALRAETEAMITRLAFSADRMTQTFEVTVEIPNPLSVQVSPPGSEEMVQTSLLIRPGLIAEVRFNLGVRKDAIAIPSDALLMDGPFLYVFVLKGKTVHARPVSVGINQGGRIEILDGLLPGDRLVTAGQKYVSDGDEVNLVKEHKGALSR